jgi:hypothetical protein
MTERDPKLDALPGDAFQTGSGTVHRVIDRFVSVGIKPGSANPGYFVETRSADGQVKLSTNSCGVFFNKIRKAVVIAKAKSQRVGWEAVERYPHSTVCNDLKRKHGHTTAV